jgi:NitT/TauT family transport system substrate-binding protein
VTSSGTTRTTVALLAALALVALTGGCSRVDRSQPSNAPDPTSQDGKGVAAELRLGYLPNITHATALIGLRRNLFAGALGTQTKLTTQTFNDGTEAVSALLGNSLDIAFIGSGPAINAFAKSKGEAVRLIAGATSGGAQLVVRPGITTAEQLRGRRIATPKLGNTQDIALKKWLADRQIPVGDGPDKVTVVNTDNPQTLDAFRTGQLDGAWLPEPWSSRLVLDAGAGVLLDERQLWPDGKFPTTVVIVRTQYLRDHPRTVQAFLRGQLAAVDWATGHPAEAQRVANTALQQLTGKALAEPVVARAFGGITLTADPLASTFPRLARDSVTAGVARSEPDLAGFVDLRPLNAVLTAAGKPTVDAAGSDTK